MRGWDHDGAFRTDEHARIGAKARRDHLRSLGLCINASVTPRGKVQHGEVVRGGRCQRCLDVKRGKAVAA